MVQAPRLPRAALAYAILAVGLAVTGLAAAYAHRTTSAHERLRFENVAHRVRHGIESRMEAYAAMLRSGAGLFAGSQEVSLAEFRAYVDRLELPTRYPGIQGIGLSQRVRPDERQAVLDRAAADGIPFGFHPEPADPRAELHAIVMLEPLDARNRLALGYDMWSDASRREAMQRARDTAGAAATGRLRLVQEAAEPGREQAGFLIYVPVYAGGGIPDTVSERRARLAGFVYSPFRADDLLRGVSGRDVASEVHVEVFDGPAAAGQLLHRSAHGERPKGAVRLTTEVAGRTWELLVWPHDPAMLTPSRALVWAIAASGAILSLLLFAVTDREIGARRRAEQTMRELRASQDALVAANRAKDDFLAVVSHELRTPLNAILGWTSILLKKPMPPDRQVHALEVIQRNAAAQARLVDDLLDMSRVVSGRLGVTREPMDLDGVVQAAVEAVRPAAESRGVKVEARIPSPLGMIEGDSARVQQILWNLLANAAKFSPQGSVVTLAGMREPRQVVLTVTDAGAGIDADLLPHVFEPFRQGDASSTRAHSGVGLGLAIARHLVEQHGGTIAARSPGRNRGATFTVTLPASS